MHLYYSRDQNRDGLILDTEVDGAVSYLGDWVGDLAKQVRPIGRMLFPENVRPGDDAEHFAFTVKYRRKGVGTVAGRGETDASFDMHDDRLGEHRDASVVTLNLNLNFVRSDLYFVDEHDSAVRHEVTLEPGHAIIHKGALRHSALPIETEERLNLST